MTRLSREQVERQIADMWDAIFSCPGGTGADYDNAVEQAHRAESTLRRKLHYQERVEGHAFEMLETLRALKRCHLLADQINGGMSEHARKMARDLVSKTLEPIGDE